MPISRSQQVCVSVNSNCEFCLDPHNVRLGLMCGTVSQASTTVQQPSYLGDATDYFSSQLDKEASETKQSDLGCATEFSVGTDDSAAETHTVTLPNITPVSMPSLRDLYPPTDFGSERGSEPGSVHSLEIGSPSRTQNLKQKSNSPQKCRRVEGMAHASRSVHDDDDQSDDEDNITLLSVGRGSETRRVRTRVYTSPVISDEEPSVTVSSLARGTVRPTSTLASQVHTAIQEEQDLELGNATEFSADGVDEQKSGVDEVANEEKVRHKIPKKKLCNSFI
jgi:hypothetical protein